MLLPLFFKNRIGLYVMIMTCLWRMGMLTLYMIMIYDVFYVVIPII